MLGGVPGGNGRLNLCGSRLAGANPPFCHSPTIQDFCSPDTFETSKYQNKICAPAKNGSVMPLFVIFRPVRKKLQLTVSFDHPVVVDVVMVMVLLIVVVIVVGGDIS